MSYSTNNGAGGGGGNGGSGTSMAGLSDYINTIATSNSGVLTESALGEAINAQYNLTMGPQQDWARQQIQQRLDEYHLNTFPTMHTQEYPGQTIARLEETPKKPEKKTELNLVELLKISEKINKKKKVEYISQIKTTEDSLNAKKSLVENTSIEIEGLEKKLEKEKKEFQEKSFEKEFEKIKALEKISDIYLLGKDIVFETTDLHVKDFYMDCKKTFKKKTKKEHCLGKFAIRINQELSEMSITNLSYESNYDLPTVQNGSCCWGNIQQDIQKDLKELNILEFIKDMLGYLESPENKNAYIRWDAYFKGRKEKNRPPRKICQNVSSYSYTPETRYFAAADFAWATNETTISPMMTTAYNIAMPYFFERFFNRFRGRGLRIDLLEYLTMDGKIYVTAWMRSIERDLEGIEPFFDYVTHRREITLFFDRSRDCALQISDSLTINHGDFRQYVMEVKRNFEEYMGGDVRYMERSGIVGYGP